MNRNKLEIEKMLNITITMPQTCHFCDKEIVKKYGLESDSLLFHSLDGNHDNWDPANKSRVIGDVTLGGITKETKIL